MKEPIFFPSPEDLYYWFEENHGTADEIYIGFYKAGSGKRGITHREAADEALCFGWAEAVMKGLGHTSYMIRFVPRRKGSVWSANNLLRFEQLLAEGRVHPAGMKAFEAFDPQKTNLYSYENRPDTLDPALERRFQANAAAWADFMARAPSYRRTCIFWVMSAKQEATRQRRLDTLIADSEAGRKIKPLDSKGGK